MLDHERMEVYQLSRELSRETCRLSHLVKRGRGDLKLQLLRATSSVPLNMRKAQVSFPSGEKHISIGSHVRQRLNAGPISITSSIWDFSSRRKLYKQSR